MNQDETESKTNQPQAPGRTEKRLARSLEDVSYLFLSQAAAPAAATDEVRGDSSGQPGSHPAEHPLPIVLGSSEALQRDPLISLLNKNSGALEDGLRAIDANIPWETGSPIDLVAVDGSNQLVIIDLETSGNDQLLLRGICHFDWFVRNVPILRRMYHGRVIDFSSTPRLFLIAPEFSPMLQRAAQRIACPRITCILFRPVSVSGGTGILFERVPPR